MSWVCSHNAKGDECATCAPMMAAAIERDVNPLRDRPCICRPSQREVDLDRRCRVCGGRIYADPELGERAS